MPRRSQDTLPTNRRTAAICSEMNIVRCSASPLENVIAKYSCNDALHNYIRIMRLNQQKLEVIRDIVRNRMVQSGVDNYAFVDGELKIGSKRYAVEACGCGESDCDGLRLRPVNVPHMPNIMPPMRGPSFGATEGTA
ncbi:MAG: hypothetical protein ABW184_00665 [Sphingobium sp.]